MTPERWKQIEEIFQSVLEREIEERAAFLDAACDGNEELRREVESLLEADALANSGFIVPSTNETKSIHTTPQLQTQNNHVGLYCPKCGASNSEKVKYCRRCGENLKILSQTMAWHLPVVLASKLDEVVENKSERFRRDGILSFLGGLLFFVFFGWKWFNGNLDVVVLFIVPFQIGWGIWELLAYKRSYDLERAPEQIAAKLKEIYCPGCGEQNRLDVKFCRKCGVNLKIVARAMTRGLPTFLARRLDSYIEYRNKQLGKNNLLMMLAFTLFVLFFGIFLLIKVSIGEGVFFIFMSFLLFGAFVWDVLTYKRNPPSYSEDDYITLGLSSDSNAKELSHASDTNKLSLHHTSHDTTSLNPAEATTRHLEVIDVSQRKEHESK